MRKRIITLLLILVSVPALWAQTKKPFVTTDVMKIASAGQLQVAPDGSKVIAVVTRKVKKSETDFYYTRHLYALNLAAGNVQQLTFGDKNDTQPAWAPDGTRVAFVRSENGKSQIWILPLSGGEAYPVTKAKNGAGNPRWSPDGNRILFDSSIPYYEIEATVPWKYERPGRTQNDEPNFKAMTEEQKKDVKVNADGSINEIRAWLARNASQDNPRVFINESFQAEQKLYTDQNFTHLFVKDLKSDTESQLTNGFQNFAGGQWFADGKQIICQSRAYKIHPDRELDTDLWTVDTGTKQAKLFLTFPGKSCSNAMFSPDGKQLLFIVKPEKDIYTAQRQLAVVSATGDKPRILTASLDRDVGSAAWAPGGQSIYFSASTEGDGVLFNVPAKGGIISKVLKQEEASVHDFEIAADKIVYGLSTIDNPSEVYVYSTKDKSQRQLTHFNEWTKDKMISVPKEYWITRPDGVKVQYWVIEPVGRKAGVNYPTILYMHGGPTGMYGPLAQWDEFQLEASWGYGVVFCNPRGSGGYGDAFKKGNMKNWGDGPAGDILGSLDDAMKNHSWIDKDQLFLAGGSYAGYMVAWIVGHDHRFKAANAQRGVYDLGTFLGEGNQYRLVPSYFGGYPWEKESKALIESESPITYVDQIRTPLLIMHSDNDLRTGVIQSETLYKSLKLLNKPVEYIRYPHEGHELSRSGNPLRMMDRAIRIIEFFERYATHPETPPAAGNY